MRSSKQGTASYGISFAPAGAMSFSPSQADHIFGSVYEAINPLNAELNPICHLLHY
jgi:hypothetical protein